MANTGSAPKKGAKTFSGLRVRKLTKKQLRIKQKSQSKNHKKVIGSFALTKQVIKLLANNYKLLTGILLVYLVLNIIFASGLGNINSDFKSIKSDLNSAGGSSGLGSAFSEFGLLVGSAGSSSNSTGAVLQTILIVVESLVIIWTLRQLIAGVKVRVKQAYYQSTAPLVPFLIIIVFGLLQLLPFSLGAVIRSAIVSSFVLSGWLSFVTGLIVVALGVWGIYMLVPTIFALYIVTLPGVMPRDAMRSAKDLVRFRRLLLLRKILFLPFFIMVCMAVITVPLILYATSLVAAVFYVLGVLGLLFAHGYLYSLYRDLIE